MRVAKVDDMKSVPENSIAWNSPSLRSQVVILVGSVVVLLSATLLVLIWILRSSQADQVAQSNKHLEAVARSMAEAYENRGDRGVSLSQLPIAFPPSEIEPPAPGHPPPPPPLTPPVKILPRPDDSLERTLGAISANVLHDETGVEGGYFSPADQRLVGYAFPTHEGPGDPTTLPARETPNIITLAAAAVSQNKLRQDKFYGTHDVVLLTAVPVCDAKNCLGGPTGAAWLMQRLAGAESDRKWTLLWSAFGFGLVACTTLLLAFLVLKQVDRGTQAVLERLTSMESDLSEAPRSGDVNLAEFHRLLDGLDRLGSTLRAQIARERELQSRLHQSERLAAIGQLAAGVAHEFRNPLATIRLRSQMAQRRTEDESIQQTTTVILAEVDRLDTIIERLLNFSRPIRLNVSRVDLSTLCRNAVTRWSARHPDVRFVFGNPEPVTTAGDAQKLDQVIDNLMENAVNQLSENKPAVRLVILGCAQDRHFTSLEIRDNGGGFTAEGLRSATEPFFSTHARGTGLGLSITQEIVAAHNGSLSIRNENDGAAVTIILPTAEVEDI